MGENDTRFYEFGRFRVDATVRELRRDGKVVNLEQKPFDLLLLFLQNPGRLLERQEIAKIWEYPHVAQYNITNAISQLRKALGGNAGDSPYIITRHGKGYQFRLEAGASDAAATAAGIAETQPERLRLRNTPALLDSARAKALVIARDYFDAELNPGGKGIRHEYQTHVCGSVRVVVDDATGLMWEHGSSGFLRGGFRSAEAYISNLNATNRAGFNNWRLPTLDEAMSLMTPAVPGEVLGEVFHLDPVFETIEPFFVWTSDVYDIDGDCGWMVPYWHPTIWIRRSGFNAYVKAVRSREM